MVTHLNIPNFLVVAKNVHLCVLFNDDIFRVRSLHEATVFPRFIGNRLVASRSTDVNCYGKFVISSNMWTTSAVESIKIHRRFGLFSYATVEVYRD